MKRYKPQELRSFLQAVDRNLESPFELVVIGGAAAALGYGVERVTGDIDTHDSSIETIRQSLNMANAETGLGIPVQYPGVEDGPYSREERFQKVTIAGLKYLAVFVPEKHDLVLMKMVRGQEQDLEVAEEIHQSKGLDPKILLSRYLSEMDHVHGRKSTLDLNFMAMMERVFGTSECEAARRAIERKRISDHS